MGRAKVTLEQLNQVKVLLKMGENYTEIARRSKTSRCFVRNTAKKIRRGESLGNRSGQGRKRSTNTAQDKFIVNLSKRNRTMSSREITSEVNASWSTNLTSRTIRGRLLEKGLKSYTQKRRPYRNTKQAKKRLAWCKTHVLWTQNEWNDVIFSDESHFEVINRKNRCFVRRTPDEKEAQFNFSVRTQGGGGTVSVWGCFTAAGTGPLIVYEGRLNADAYIDVISEALPSLVDDIPLAQRPKCKFMQDNAPCHTAKKTMTWLQRFKQTAKVDCMDWPPTSPDMNPIENIWEIIDQRLKTYQISTKQQLEAAIKDVWHTIDVATCAKLVKSVPKRVKAVMKAKGGNISHY